MPYKGSGKNSKYKDQGNVGGDRIVRSVTISSREHIATPTLTTKGTVRKAPHADELTRQLLPAIRERLLTPPKDKVVENDE